uniref:FUZ/MON1/HPS1 third Longin domain-containing protein n=1 Tax=Timema poppense TaxID=170557 RepID=A0A7R9H1C8_TIMPO|nr:unnamed protein product [Timema poppensis]
MRKISSLTINKYLEEFPGLVHFLYIDRTNHRVTAPSLDFSSEETMSLTKKKGSENTRISSFKQSFSQILKLKLKRIMGLKF